ncbi:MAG: hypothetical protein ACRD12_06305 [Acidimicrobiales bacterium]
MVVGLAALLTFGGMGFLPALNLVTAASSVAAYGQGVGTFLRDPREASKDYLRNLTPAELATQITGAALGRILPAAGGGLVGRRIRREALSQAEQAAISRSRGALDRAVDGAAEVGASHPKGRGKAVASDGGKTVSGWRRPRPPGYDYATPEQVRDVSNQIGHDLRPGGPRDQLAQGGWTGKFHASHAEKQQAVLHPNMPVAVSKDMCVDCRSFYGRLAVNRQKAQIVTDPHYTWIFRPDGTVDRVPIEGAK